MFCFYEMPLFSNLTTGQKIGIWLCIAIVIALIIAVIVIVILKCCCKQPSVQECFKINNIFRKRPKTVEKFEGSNDTNRWNYVNSYINSVLGNSFAVSASSQPIVSENGMTAVSFGSSGNQSEEPINEAEPIAE